MTLYLLPEGRSRKKMVGCLDDPLWCILLLLWHTAYYAVMQYVRRISAVHR